MDIAIVTGANKGIGLAIAKKLITLGCRVYALGDDFSKTPYAHKDFFPTSSNEVDTILSKEDNIYILVNAHPHSDTVSFEALPQADLQTQLANHLTTPLQLTHLLLPKIKQFQGFIINITSSAYISPLNAAIHGAIKAFSDSLFNELRNSGTSVTHIITEGDDINPDQVANAIDQLIRYKGANAVTEMVLRPQATDNTTQVPQLTPSVDQFREVQLPPKDNYPEERELITTTEAKPRPPRKTVKKKAVRPAPRPKRETSRPPAPKKKVVKKRPIPRKPAAKKPEPTIEDIPESKPTPTRMRRGRPSSKKQN